MTDFKYSFIAGTLSQLGDRYLRTGYKERQYGICEIAKKMSEYNLVDGIELHYRGNETETEISELKEILEQNSLHVSCVNTWLYGQIKWSNGSFTSRDQKTNQEARKHTMDAIDYARKLNAECVGLWLGQDGHDYAFQADYSLQWKQMLEAMRFIADEASDIKIALEPKKCEPRNHLVLDTTYTALLMCLEADRNNLGLTLDLGHALYAGEAMGKSITLCDHYNRLFNIHINDNRRNWDDDMIFGSIHLMEHLEAVYLLKKLKYKDYVSVDIFPYRENQFEAVAESIQYFKVFNDIIDLIGMQKIAEIIASGNPIEFMKLLREHVFDKGK